jgi:two-component system response regulator FimZ (fimbrial Z protein)
VDAGAYHSNRTAAAQPSAARVLVVDRSRAFAEGLVVLLHSAGIAAQASDVDALDQVSGDERFNVLVIDGRLAEQATNDGLGPIRERVPDCQLLLIVDDAEQSSARVAELTGAATWLSRHSEPEVLIGTVQALHECRDVARRRGSQPSHSGQTITAQLTGRELAVLRLLSQGVSNLAVAEGLGISPNTVRTHVRNLLVKLNVHSRAEAIALTTQPGVIDGNGHTIEKTACG